MIRTTYPDRICYRLGVMFTSAVCFSLRESGEGSAPHVLLRNPDRVDPDSLAHSVSSGRGVPIPCTRRRSPLRSIAQSTWGRIPCANISHPEFRASTFHIKNSVRRHFTSEILCFNILHPDISQPDGRGGRFNFPGQTYPDPLIALTRRILQPFCTMSRCSPEASRYVRPTFEIFFSQCRDVLLKLPDMCDRHL